MVLKKLGKTFLVAFDGSPISQAAVEKAIYFANKKRDDEIIIAFIYNSKKQVQMIDENLLKEMENRVKEAEINVKIDLIDSQLETAEALCEITTFNSIDFLVLGNRGFSGLKSKIYGSTCEYCLHHCKCTVIVTKIDDYNPFD